MTGAMVATLTIALTEASEGEVFWVMVIFLHWWPCFISFQFLFHFIPVSVPGFITSHSNMMPEWSLLCWLRPIFTTHTVKQCKWDLHCSLWKEDTLPTKEISPLSRTIFNPQGKDILPAKNKILYLEVPISILCTFTCHKVRGCAFSAAVTACYVWPGLKVSQYKPVLNIRSPLRPSPNTYMNSLS